MMTKPTRIEAGQRWEVAGAVWVADETPMSGVKCRMRNERSGLTATVEAGWFASPVVSYLGPGRCVRCNGIHVQVSCPPGWGTPLGAPVMGGAGEQNLLPGQTPAERVTDWSRWLPPNELPDTGRKVQRAGQVWAMNNAVLCVVYRVVERRNGNWTYETLAGKDANPKWYTDEAPFATQAVLVADVGCESTPPEVLFGTPEPSLRGDQSNSQCSIDGITWIDCGCRGTHHAKTRARPAHKPGVRVGQRWRISLGVYGGNDVVITAVTARGAIKFDWSGGPRKGSDGAAEDWLDLNHATLIDEGTESAPAESLESAPASPPAVQAAPELIVREVSTDGRNYTDYERLTDADPFIAYPYRRWVQGGVVKKSLAPPPRREETAAWADHVREDLEYRFAMDCMETARAGSEATEQPKNLLHLPGESPPQQHSYYPRSLSEVGR